MLVTYSKFWVAEWPLAWEMSVEQLRFTARAFRKLLSIYVHVFSYLPFGFQGRMWDLIASVPDHCLSFYSVQ